MRTIATVLGTLASLTGAVEGAVPVLWSFDLTTTGNDVAWVSPTAVSPLAPSYLAAYEITLVEMRGTFFGFPVGPINVTDEIPPENRMGEGSWDGAPPAVLLDADLAFPLPPAPPSLSGHVLISVDAAGFGHAEITDVTLGTIAVDLGPPFGVVNVTLTSVRVAGMVTITPELPGDLDGDCDVDIADLSTLLSNFATGITPADGDLDGDGDVDIVDLATCLSNFGIVL